MSVIATTIPGEGVARIFFDLRPQPIDLAEVERIAAVIERAFATATPEEPRRAA